MTVTKQFFKDDLACYMLLSFIGRLKLNWPDRTLGRKFQVPII